MSLAAVKGFFSRCTTRTSVCLCHPFACVLHSVQMGFCAPASPVCHHMAPAHERTAIGHGERTSTAKRRVRNQKFFSSRLLPLRHDGRQQAEAWHWLANDRAIATARPSPRWRRLVVKVKFQHWTVFLWDATTSQCRRSGTTAIKRGHDFHSSPSAHTGLRRPSVPRLKGNKIY